MKAQYGCAVKADGSVVGLTQVQHLIPIFSLDKKPIPIDDIKDIGGPEHFPHLDVYGEAPDLKTFRANVQNILDTEPDAKDNYHTAEKVLALKGYIVGTDGY